jgi:hypothetical protein
MKNIGSLILLLLIVLAVQTTHAVSITREAGTEKEASWVVVPYAFDTESLSFAYGLAGGAFGYLQPQMTTYGAVMATTNESYGLYLVVSKFEIPGIERLFLNTYGSAARHTEYREYLQGNPLFADERAGSNESSKENFLTGEGWNRYLELKFRYALPVGEGRAHVINTYELDRGVLVNGSTYRGEWNPLESGRTYLEIEPFYRRQSYHSEFAAFEEYKTSGVGIGLHYDNTDFIDNPSWGSQQRIRIMRDPGIGDNTFAWTALDAEASKYFSLGENKVFRQQTIGINFWTAWSPTWEEEIVDGQVRTINRPPDYYGANLGGFYRMRAFPQRRFHDKAGIYYSLEYRVMPQWQPLPDVSWLRPFEIDWWQAVFFAEVGRVAPEWNLKTMHRDMKVDFGVSLRMMIMRAVGRLDVAVSNEGASVKALIGHPF